MRPKHRERITAVDLRTVRAWRRPWLLVAALIGAFLLAVSWYWASDGNVPAAEVEVFRWLNDFLPDGLEWVLWAPMQFGAIGAVAGVAVGQLVLTRRWLATLMTVVVGLEAWAIAKVIKPIVDRGRPGVEIDDVIHRGGSVGGGIDAGHGFVSGHAAIAAALAVALTVVLPPRWRWVPWLLTLIVGIGRNYFGAHLPLDIVGGYGLGLILAGLTLAAMGRISDRRKGEPRSERARPRGRDVGTISTEARGLHLPSRVWPRPCWLRMAVAGSFAGGSCLASERNRSGDGSTDASGRRSGERVTPPTPTWDASRWPAREFSPSSPSCCCSPS